jgi:uncharacterized protein (TIGR00255 family)
MTGFGRSSREVQGLGLEVEARSVNHRHMDLRVRLPRILSASEASIRGRIQGRMNRGKVDVTISLTGLGTAERLAIDDAIAAQYVEASRLLRERHDLAEPLDVATLLTLPGVTRIVESELDPDALLGPIEEAVDEAIDNLIAMRSTEGAALAQEIGGRLKTIEGLALAFEARSGEVLGMAKRRLQKRAEQIKRDVGLLDDARLYQEIVIAADRLDITEELVRLRSHIAQFRDIMSSADSGKSVGRRLDFLLQELGREANTVGSKANDAPLAHDVVELKTELERIREQVQNVE